MKAAAHLWQLTGLGGLQLMRARCTGQTYTRHGHETFALGVVEAGQEEIRFRDGVERTGPGAVLFIDPEVVHTGVAIGDGWFQYRVAYPSAEVMTELGGGRGLPTFPDRVSYDPRTAGLIARAHAVAETEDALSAESSLAMCLAWLVRVHGSTASSASAISSASSSPAAGARATPSVFVLRIRDLLHERLLDPPNLEELAAEAGAPALTVLRSFRAAYGLPPHAYLTQLRVRRALKLLDQGLPPAEVATAVGFFDQAHLSRHFRRIVGVPPGVYRRSRNFVQAPTGQARLA